MAYGLFFMQAKSTRQNRFAKCKPLERYLLDIHGDLRKSFDIFSEFFLFLSLIFVTFAQEDSGSRF